MAIEIRDGVDYMEDVRTLIETYTNWLGLDLAFQNLESELENPASVRRLVSMCGQNREMLLHGKDTFLAGDCIMSVYMPEVMRETARRRLINAENAGAETLVAESPAEYIRLKAESGKVRVITVQDMVLENIK